MMRNYVRLIALALVVASVGFVSKGSIPGLNQKVKEYVSQVIGTKVDRGECWDLASEALNYAGAYLDRTNEKNLYIFGERINHKKEKVYPGDIIQFENVTLEYREGNTIYTETMSHHTAIVYDVIATHHYEIAHQNTSFSGKKVGISELKLDNVKKGEMIFYRPTRK